MKVLLKITMFMHTKACTIIWLLLSIGLPMLGGILRQHRTISVILALMGLFNFLFAGIVEKLLEDIIEKYVYKSNNTEIKELVDIWAYNRASWEDTYI
jgi:hypothetical protein